MFLIPQLHQQYPRLVNHLIYRILKNSKINIDKEEGQEVGINVEKNTDEKLIPILIFNCFDEFIIHFLINYFTTNFRRLNGNFWGKKRIKLFSKIVKNPKNEPPN